MAGDEPEFESLSEIRTLDDAITIIKSLCVEVRLLRVESAELRAENQQLKEENATLRSEMAALRSENVQLREKVARLEKNSSTSSKPPSSDITQPPEKQRQKGKRRIGGQKGHKANFRQAFSPEEVDTVHDLYLDHCPDCGSKLCDLEHEEIITQQSVELPEKLIEVEEFRRHGCLCGKCNVYHYPPLPAGVIEGQLLGPRLQALFAFMKGNHGISYTELQQFCTEVLKLPISQGVLAKTIERVSRVLERPYEELKTTLPEEKRLNVDETGWKEQGKSFWVWAFCAPLIALFTISSSRGSKVLKEILGETFGGALTSDFFSAYVSFATALQQFCLAHLIRDIKFLTTLPDENANRFGARLLKYFRTLFSLWHRRAEYPPGEFEKKVDRLLRKIYTYVSTVDLPKGEARTLKRRIIRHWAALFRFVANPDLFEPTNNRAERILRHVVRIRRNTQGSRGENGRVWNERVLTVLATCRLQKKSPWDFMLQAVHAHHFGAPWPSLLPA